VLVAALPGVPLLYNGQEVASEDNTSLFEKDPIDFDRNPEVRAFYRRFLEVRAESEALLHGELSFPLPEERDVVILERATDAERVVVIANPRPRLRRVALPPGLAGETFTDLMTGETVELPEGELSLERYAYFLLSTNQL
jgi:glycosidase